MGSYTLCVFSNLTSAEWAAWVQAIFSVIAIIGAAWIAVWQSKKQHQSALELHKEEQRYAQLEQAKTLFVLCDNCTKAIGHFVSQLNNREAVHKIASKETYFDFGELSALQNATTNIPLHSIPAKLVTYAMVLAATVRQFKQTIDMTMELHRDMDAFQYEELFQTLAEMKESLALTSQDISSAMSELGIRTAEI